MDLLSFKLRTEFLTCVHIAQTKSLIEPSFNTAVCETVVDELPAVEEDRPRCRIEFEEVCRKADGSCTNVPKRVCVLATELVTKVTQLFFGISSTPPKY